MASPKSVKKRRAILKLYRLFSESFSQWISSECRILHDGLIKLSGDNLQLGIYRQIVNIAMDMKVNLFIQVCNQLSADSVSKDARIGSRKERRRRSSRGRIIHWPPSTTIELKMIHLVTPIPLVWDFDEYEICEHSNEIFVKSFISSTWIDVQYWRILFHLENWIKHEIWTHLPSSMNR